MSLLSSIFPSVNEARRAQMSTLELLENANEQLYAIWVAVPRLLWLPSHLGTPDQVFLKRRRRLWSLL